MLATSTTDPSLTKLVELLTEDALHSTDAPRDQPTKPTKELKTSKQSCAPLDIRLMVLPQSARRKNRLQHKVRALPTAKTTEVNPTDKLAALHVRIAATTQATLKLPMMPLALHAPTVKLGGLAMWTTCAIALIPTTRRRLLQQQRKRL